MHASVVATIKSNKKFHRFSKKVLHSYDPLRERNLKLSLKNYELNLAAFIDRNKTKYNYGFARIDAFGIIMNELFVDELKIPNNLKEPNAPVSYSFLWGTPRHDWVQWNGGANNPLGRNIGEVLGTFGSINLVEPEKFGVISARANELIILENLVALLNAPKWPENVFGKINQDKTEKGRRLYQQYRKDEPSCASCMP